VKSVASAGASLEQAGKPEMEEAENPFVGRPPVVRSPRHLRDEGTDGAAATFRRGSRDYAESQSAVISLPYSMGKAVLHRGEVRIGWNICRIRKRTGPQDASNAWNPGILQLTA